MTKILIKITNEVVDGIKHRLVCGLSGKEYVFMADAGEQAYIYEPKELPFEVRDIFGVVAQPFFPWRFEPVLVEGEAGDQRVAPFRVTPYVTPDKYENHTLAELLALAEDCGFHARMRHDAEAVRAQLESYFMGRAVGEKAARLGVGANGEVPPPAPPKPKAKSPKREEQPQLEV